jgi:hypothetical protein
MNYLCLAYFDLKKYTYTKETKGRSSRQTPFTLKPKQLAPKTTIFNPKKYFSNFLLNFFTFVLSNFLVRTLQCKNLFKKSIFAHEDMKKQPSKVAHNSQPAFFFITGLAAQKARFRQK